MSGRRALIAANWKMHKTRAEALAFVMALQGEIGVAADREVVIAPPFTSLEAVSQVLTNRSVFRLAAQNCHFEERGAFTGEISPLMLQDLGCDFVIIGHSERRHIFSETDEMVRRKVEAVFRAGMLPMVCVGEVLAERERGETFKVVETQVRKAVEGVNLELAPKLVIAYEPVWAIGTGRTATPGQAQEVHAFIRGLAGSMFNQEVANNLRIVYGGSVKPENVDTLMTEADIDGMLVGGASLEVDSFKRIVLYRSLEEKS